jgi:hypothetical protein
MTTLFEPGELGGLALRNRIVMAPMTRSRAGAGDVPTELHVEYSRQRATAGFRTYWHLGAPLAPFERRTLYTAGAKGYIDYPYWQGA